MAGRQSRSSREQTDARLTVERAKTDKELVRRTRATAAGTDAAVQAARHRAADVVRTARRRADARMRSANRSNVERHRVETARAREDAVVQKEYAHADRLTGRRRAASARLVAELLRQERQDTDRSLLLERADADTILSRRDEFLGMVSHDIRNELTAITLSVSDILTKAAADEGARKILHPATNIQRTALRMSRLIADLLDVASIDAGKFVIVPEVHQVGTTVQDVVESFAPIASGKGIALEVSGIDAALAARFDRQRIQQVLGNLLVNALNHTAERGRVSVGAERRPREVWFTVGDSGCGIAADRLESIFERFSPRARRDRKGLGLGLYIARQIVEAHGGRIWAESAPGRGSTFHFVVPLRFSRRRARRRSPDRSPKPARTD